MKRKAEVTIGIKPNLLKKGLGFFMALVFLTLPGLAQGAGNTYYVSVSSGNDSNNGTSISTPWKTIAKVNSSTLQPGDQVLFKRGDVWREQLIVPSSGTQNSPILFGTFGTGNTPTISGADTVTGWTQYSGNIYVANVGSIPAPTQLYMDGWFYDSAHYPDSGYLLATSTSTDTTSIIDSNLTLTSGQIVGATVVTRPVFGYISTAIAASYNSTTHTMTTNVPVDKQVPSMVMRTGFGFYLKDMLWMLDSPGEWFYDASAGKLYLWPPLQKNDSLANHTIEVSNRPYGISGNGKNYITVQNLAFVNANQYDVSFSNANNVTLNNLTVSGGQMGIFFINMANSTINNSSVQKTLSNGINIDPNGVNSYITITKNTINNAGNTGINPKFSYAGLYVSGSNFDIDGNTVSNSGYNGIGELRGDHNLIQNNIIDRSCLVLDDCGGIYSWHSTGSSINHNAVTNSIGNPNGTARFNGTPLTFTQAEGIYLDDLTNGYSVTDNTVDNVDWGVYIHSGWNHTITGNSVYNARSYGLMIQEDASSPSVPGTVHNNVITGNNFETLATTTPSYFYPSGGVAYYTSNVESLTVGFGTYNNNMYCHPNTGNFAVNQNISYTFSAWKAFSGQDANSTDTNAYCPRPPSTNYYVNGTTGNDSNPGTLAQPFKTIVYAYSLATPGTTIIVMPGTYTEYQNIDGGLLYLNKSGTAFQPITLKSQIKGQAIIDGQNSLNRRMGVFITGGYNILDGFEIKNAYIHGIVIWSNNNQILNNQIDHNGNLDGDVSGYPGEDHSGVLEGSAYSPGPHPFDHNFFMGNYVHHNGRSNSNLDHGLYLYGTNGKVFNNILTYSSGGNLKILGVGINNNVMVYNNLFAYTGNGAPTQDGILIGDSISYDIEIKNNIFYMNGISAVSPSSAYGIRTWNEHGSGIVVDHNIFFGNHNGNYNFTDGGSDVSYTLGTNFFVDPQFVSPTSNNFYLQSISPAIGNGINLSSYFTSDYAGSPRPASGNWDIGVYQYSSSPTVTGAGDVDGDGAVTIADAELTAQYSMGLTVPNLIQANAMVDGKSAVDIYDAFLIAEYVMGQISKFPVQP
jgi:parallel beta-helix repeat protein